jgi:phosphonate transport system substrate-binding protein
MSTRPLPTLAALCAVALWVLASLSVVGSCEGRDTAAVGREDTPFIFMLSPAHRPTAGQRERLADFLSRHSGLTIEVAVAPSAEEAVTTAGTNHAEAWLVPLFSYLFCVQEYGVEAGLQVVREGGSVEYAGELVVRGEGGATRLEELQGQAVAYVEPHSTSGFLLPAVLLREAGVETEPVFAGSHEAALMLLRNGEVAAAAVHEGLAEDDPGLRVLARTRSVPNEPIFFRQDLPPETRRRFSEALLAYAETAEGRAVLGSMAEIAGFVPATNEQYQEVYEVLHASDRSLEDLVPRGWLIRNLNRLTPVDFAP